jgi:hypothetical protein
MYSESQMNKYVCKLMSVVYTRDEMKEGLIIEGEATTSTRKRLDLDKFNLIKSKLLIDLKTNNLPSYFY